MNPEGLAALLRGEEREGLEFKEAKTAYSAEKALRYCAALANEGGGHLVLGVTDRAPRRVVGTQAFLSWSKLARLLLEKLRLRVHFHELAHPDGRVLVLAVPPRPVGLPLAVDGVYWMRSGESLVPMTPDLLARILQEATVDHSATLLSELDLGVLEPRAVEVFRRLWIRHGGSPELEQTGDAQLLEDAALARDGMPTLAALVLLGRPESLTWHLPQAELIFEYRSTDATGPAQQRVEWRAGFLLWFDEAWRTINLRNDRQHYARGLFVREVPTFHEQAVREVLLNAVAHRDYRLAGSVFVRQYPRRLEVVSPGGLPRGITPENMLWRQAPRNACIAQAFQRCGLVERAGQGMNRIFETSIRHGKARPELGGTDEHHVEVTLHGAVEDERFLRFLEEIGDEQLARFGTEHFLVLDLVRRGAAVPEALRDALQALTRLGVVEHRGRGRGTRYVLSRAPSDGTDSPAHVVDRERLKEQLRELLRRSAPRGASMTELCRALPRLSRHQVLALLKELQLAEDVCLRGRGRGARWQLAE
ncbi:MAG: putative DNA binding domain-containing protein [Alphaproteobacteria bacterium]|nr:putative DNA binding domain-containing protein [Alphaproteobacteria bacterium]